MIDIPEYLRPVVALGCPALGSILILLFGRRPNLREGVTLLASLLQFLIVFSMVPRVMSGETIQAYLFPILPGIHFGFRVDAFGLMFAITASFLWILVSIYSIGYMRALQEHAQTRYYFCFALAILGAVGVALSGNLVTMYIFYEILTVSTYPLVAHEQSSEALFAGSKYLAYLLTSGVFLLAAIVFTYSMAETTDFSPKGILSFITGGGTYKEDKFEEDADRVTEYYRNRGYARVRIGQPDGLDDLAQLSRVGGSLEGFGRKQASPDQLLGDRAPTLGPA